MLIDELMPQFDRTKVEHVIIDAEPARVYAALLEADLVQAYKGSRAMRVLAAIRTVPAALVRLMRKEPRPAEPESLRIGEAVEEGEWVKLGEDPGRELVVGAIGRFWGRDVNWERIRASEFKDFDRPGYGKIACDFSVRPYGTDRSLLTYEARVLPTDAPARRGIRRYWLLVSPGIAIYLRGALRYIKRSAERP